MQSFLHHSEFTDLVSAQEHDAQGTGVISDGTVYLSQQKTHGSGSYARNLNLADHEMHPHVTKGTLEDITQGNLYSQGAVRIPWLCDWH